MHDDYRLCPFCYLLLDVYRIDIYVIRSDNVAEYRSGSDISYAVD